MPDSPDFDPSQSPRGEGTAPWGRSPIKSAALDKAYEAGRIAAFSTLHIPNPYSYRAEKALYWEYDRGYRDCLYGEGK